MSHVQACVSLVFAFLSETFALACVPTKALFALQCSHRHLLHKDQGHVTPVLYGLNHPEAILHSLSQSLRPLHSLSAQSQAFYSSVLLALDQYRYRRYSSSVSVGYSVVQVLFNNSDISYIS